LLATNIPGCDDNTSSSVGDVQRLATIDERFNLGAFDYARTVMQQYIKNYPQSVDGWNLLGWTYAKTDELDKANESFDKSLQLDPKNDNAYVGKGVIFRKQGNNEQAKASYLKAIEIKPNNAEAFSSLMTIEIMAGNNDKAVEFGERAWALRKDLAGIPANLAIGYHLIGDHAKRELFFEKAKSMKYHNMEGLKDIFDGKTEIPVNKKQ
jgi:Tfp pilus assembly protein PilF